LPEETISQGRLLSQFSLLLLQPAEEAEAKWGKTFDKDMSHLHPLGYGGKEAESGA
jgi:hypothetical protein